MKHIFIINPAAGKGKAGKEFLPQIIDTVKKTGIEYEIHRTMGPGDAANFVKGRCKENEPEQSKPKELLRFYACGGDGTLNEVVNGVFGYNVEIGMIPAGTGNDFVRNFNNQKGFSDIQRQINGKSKVIDVIKYSADTSDGSQIRYGINMFNIGLDSNVAVKAAEIKKNFLISGSLAYLLGIGLVLGRKEGVTLDIEFDDGTKKPGKIMLIAIANGSYCGGGFKGVPYAEIDDGLIDVSIVEDVNRRTLVSLLSKYRKGTHMDSPVCKDIITYKKCKHLTIKPADQMQLCTDGEIEMRGEVQFEIVKNAIKFSIPQGCEY